MTTRDKSSGVFEPCEVEFDDKRWRLPRREGDSGFAPFAKDLLPPPWMSFEGEVEGLRPVMLYGYDAA